MQVEKTRGRLLERRHVGRRTTLLGLDLSRDEVVPPLVLHQTGVVLALKNLMTTQEELDAVLLFPITLAIEEEEIVETISQTRDEDPFDSVVCANICPIDVPDFVPVETYSVVHALPVRLCSVIETLAQALGQLHDGSKYFELAFGWLGAIVVLGVDGNSNLGAK